MLPNDPVDQIKADAAALNLKPAELARRARLAKSTAYRVFAGAGAHQRTISALQRVLAEAKERARDHLMPPQPEQRP